MDEIEELKRYLRNFSYVNPIFFKLIESYNILCFEICSTIRELNKQIECDKNNISELLSNIKNIIHYKDEHQESFELDVYLYDTKVFIL